MASFCIGDIHGYAKPLSVLLEAINPSKSDIVITLGDYIDRGPQSSAVIDTLLELGKKTQLVGMRGNHEQMLLDCFDNKSSDFKMWLVNGAKPTFQSYGLQPSKENVKYLPAEHIQFLKNTLEIAEGDKHIFVHGGIDPNADLNKQSSEVVLWNRFEKAKPHKSGKITICGHTPQTSGYPNDKGHSICLDTGIIDANGWLSCMNVNTKEVVQVNRKLKFRSFILK